MDSTEKTLVGKGYHKRYNLPSTAGACSSTSSIGSGSTGSSVEKKKNLE